MRITAFGRRIGNLMAECRVATTAYQHFGYDVINQPGGAFRHAPRPARGANAAPLEECEPVVVPAGIARARLARAVHAASRRRSTVLHAGGSLLLRLFGIARSAAP